MPLWLLNNIISQYLHLVLMNLSRKELHLPKNALKKLRLSFSLSLPLSQIHKAHYTFANVFCRIMSRLGELKQEYKAQRKDALCFISSVRRKDPLQR